MAKRDNRHNERLAYHEAGHAVVGYRLGYKITKVTIERNARTSAEGETIVIPPNASIITYLFKRIGVTNEREDNDEIAYRMAGVEAVRIAGCERIISIEGSELSDDIVEARGDILTAINIAKRVGRGVKLPQDLAFESGKSMATAILEANVDALNAIAKALLEKGTLSGTEVTTIIDSHPPTNYRESPDTKTG